MHNTSGKYAVRLTAALLQHPLLRLKLGFRQHRLSPAVNPAVAPDIPAVLRHYFCHCVPLPFRAIISE